MKSRSFINSLVLMASAGFLTLAPGQGHAQNDALEIGGHYKNFFVTSQTTGTEEGFFADTNRLRLEMKKIADPWQFYLTVDNEAVIHDFGNTPDFGYIRSRTQNDLADVDLDTTSRDRDHLYIRHAIYRAYVKYYQPDYQITVGKQAVDWGKLRFYSPLDIFNPIGAIDLERDVRPGIDAINVNYSFTDFSGVNLVVAPGTSDEETQAGARFYKTIGTYDVSAIAAVIRKSIVTGVAFDGYLKDAGLRGEITFNHHENGREYVRAGIGIDYNISEKIYVLAEQFYNGGHDDNDIARFLGNYRYSHDLLSLQRHLTSLWLKYQFNPLWEGNTYLIYDWEDQSVVVNPELRHNMSANTELAVGAQLFWGDSTSEFGSYQHLAYAEFKWHF